MRSDVKVTIGILTYNSARTLGDTLNSLSAQSLDPSLWEVVIVDHNSSDDTLELCEKFRKVFSKTRVIENAENHIANSRQFILQHSQSEWIAFLDSDVVIPTHWLQSALELAQERRNCPRFSGVGSPLELRPQSPKLAILREIQKHFLGHFATEQMHISSRLRKVGHLPTAAAVFRRGDLMEVGGFQSRWRFCGEDLEMGSRLCAVGKELWISPTLHAIHQLSCQTWWDWSVRAFRFGRTRIQVALSQPRLWREFRTWLPLLFGLPYLVLGFLFVFTANPLWIILLVSGLATYLAALWFYFGRLQAALLSFATHNAFAWGELYGILTAPLTRKPC